MKRILTFSLLSFIAQITFSQDHDTLMHSTDFTLLHFEMANETEASFEVLETYFKIDNGDTISATINLDTFFLKRVNSIDSEITYQFKPYPDTWNTLLLRKSCDSKKEAMANAPVVNVRYNRPSNAIEIVDCEQSITYLKKGIQEKLATLDKSENRSAVVSAENLMKKITDCSYQASYLLSDLSQPFKLRNLPVPLSDSAVQFSLITAKDSTRWAVTKSNSDNHLIYKLTEVVKDRDPNEQHMMTSVFSKYRKERSKEETKKDSIRRASKVENNFSEITLNEENQLIRFEKIKHSSMLNKDMKPKEHQYSYYIRRL